ncbi:MAG TPA: NAD(P)/FAD-dependent oxidoreductase [Acidimicrobiales bacterium]|nr:NAD(P)/FAD-dependent oxidoreductase [Acidimicrobiales bacterium]
MTPTAPLDAVVVGGGPAGLSAATWLARYRRSVVVLDSGEYRNRWVDRSHGYLGADPQDPMRLLERAREDLGRYETATLRADRATAVRRDDAGRFVVTTEGGELVALRLVLATGVVDAFPEVDGFLDHYGASVFHCPTCDGYEARDRRVVVLGWSEHVAGFALGLLDWAAELTIVSDDRPFEGEERHRAALARHGVALLEDDAVAFEGHRGDLRAVHLQSGVRLPADLVFFSIAHHPRTDLAAQLGCELTGQGCLRVDHDGQTTVEGVYAAGDVTPGIQLASVAAGKGTVAGVSCADSLRGERGATTSPDPAPDPEAEVG